MRRDDADCRAAHPVFGLTAAQLAQRGVEISGFDKASPSRSKHLIGADDDGVWDVARRRLRPFPAPAAGGWRAAIRQVAAASLTSGFRP